MKKARKGHYVDGFVIAMPKKNLARYRKIAAKACTIWMRYGAIDYRECIGDDLDVKGVVPFTKIAKAKKGETVIFSWITYKSRADRDRVNKLIMKDPVIAKMMTDSAPVFDLKKMTYGGFKVIVAAP